MQAENEKSDRVNAWISTEPIYGNTILGSREVLAAAPPVFSMHLLRKALAPFERQSERALTLRLRFLIIAMLLTTLYGADAANAGGIKLSKVAKKLGIRGEAGQLMSKIDKFAGRGTSLAAEGLGLPGSMIFSQAIQDWQTANEKVIDKLGRTNDATVKTLVFRLDSLRDSTVATIGDALESSVESLDLTLQAAVQDLDQSLTSQTSRLDAILDKQLDSLYQIVMWCLRMMLLYMLLTAGASSLGLLRTAGSADKRPHAVMFSGAMFVAAAVGLLVSFIVGNDPLKRKQRLEETLASYQRALDQEDFARARVASAVLTALGPSSDDYNWMDRRAVLFRAVSARPTLLYREDELSRLFGTLSFEDFDNDGDIRSLLLLTGVVSAQSERAYLEALILASTLPSVPESLNKNASLGIRQSYPVPVLRRASEEVSHQLARLSLPTPLLLLALEDSTGVNGDSGRIALKNSIENAVQTLKRNSNTAARDAQTSYSAFAELAVNAKTRLAVREYYRTIEALYVTYRTAKSTYSNAKEHEKAFCGMVLFADSASQVIAKSTDQDMTLSASMLAGPFSLIERAAKEQVGVRCESYSSIPIDTARLSSLSNQISFWSSVAEGTNPSAKGRNAVRILKRASTESRERQNVAFESFDNRLSAYLLAKVGGTDLKKPLLDYALSSAALGMFGPMKDERRLAEPVVFSLYQEHKLPLTESEWKQVFRTFLEAGENSR